MSIDLKINSLLKLAGSDFEFQPTIAIKTAEKTILGNVTYQSDDRHPAVTRQVTYPAGMEYSRETCDTITELILLPLKQIKGQALHIGLTCKRTLGSYGKPVIMACHFDIEPKSQISPVAHPIYSKNLRATHERCGKSVLQVAWDSQCRNLVSGDSCVWFSLEDLVLLSQNPMFCDMATMLLTGWVLNNRKGLEKPITGQQWHSLTEQ